MFWSSKLKMCFKIVKLKTLPRLNKQINLKNKMKLYIIINSVHILQKNFNWTDVLKKQNNEFEKIQIMLKPENCKFLCNV